MGVYLNRAERQRKLTLEETYIPVFFFFVLNFVDAPFCRKLFECFGGQAQHVYSIVHGPPINYFLLQQLPHQTLLQLLLLSPFVWYL